MATDVDGAIKELATQLGLDIKGLLAKSSVPGPRGSDGAAGQSINTVALAAGATEVPTGTPANSVVIRLK